MCEYEALQEDDCTMARACKDAIKTKTMAIIEAV